MKSKNLFYNKKAETSEETNTETNSQQQQPPQSLTIDSLAAQTSVDSQRLHHSQIDLKKMRVDELRVQLEARGLDAKGYKQQLLQKLRDAIQIEKVPLLFTPFCLY